jgi:hypothetical protein
MIIYQFLGMSLTALVLLSCRNAPNALQSVVDAGRLIIDDAVTCHRLFSSCPPPPPVVVT